LIVDARLEFFGVLISDGFSGFPVGWFVFLCASFQ
jgi:hypothetical protein